MRSWAVAAATAALLVAATGCTVGTGTKSGVLASASGAGGGARGGGGAGGDVIDAAVCDQVRQGIDAFNDGDYDATVDHFTQAVPLAHQRVVADDTRANEQLLEAVVYYAQLAPTDYPDAARSSPEFQQYKIITLGQCEGGAPASASPSAPGLDT